MKVLRSIYRIDSVVPLVGEKPLKLERSTRVQLASDEVVGVVDEVQRNAVALLVVKSGVAIALGERLILSADVRFAWSISLVRREALMLVLRSGGVRIAFRKKPKFLFDPTYDGLDRELELFFKSVSQLLTDKSRQRSWIARNRFSTTFPTE